MKKKKEFFYIDYKDNPSLRNPNTHLYKKKKAHISQRSFKRTSKQLQHSRMNYLRHNKVMKHSSFFMKNVL